MKKKANKTIEQLRRFESRNVTFIEPDGSWPIVWERAKGMRVWDDDGREYLDFTAAFAVAAAGHANARIVAAGQRQMAKLLHAMGDVHPHALKAELARELSRLTFERLAKRTGKTIFCNSGFEGVEAALKTAHLATGRTRVIAFEDAYHGLGYGALNATWRSEFRSPFRRQIGGFASFVPFPCARADLAKLEPGQGQYTLLCQDNGGVIDDLYAYRLGDTRHLLIVNASRLEIDWMWIKAQRNSRHKSLQLEVSDRSGELSAMALQGPKAAEIITGVFPAATELRKNQIAELEFGGATAWVSRTGYTGELCRLDLNLLRFYCCFMLPERPPISFFLSVIGPSSRKTHVLHRNWVSAVITAHFKAEPLPNFFRASEPREAVRL